jgi:hypothetical protein
MDLSLGTAIELVVNVPEFQLVPNEVVGASKQHGEASAG